MEKSLKAVPELFAVIACLNMKFPNFMEGSTEERHACALVMGSTPGDWIPARFVPTLRRCMEVATTDYKMSDGNVYFYRHKRDVYLYNPKGGSYNNDQEVVTFVNDRVLVDGVLAAQTFTLASLFENEKPETEKV